MNGPDPYDRRLDRTAEDTQHLDVETHDRPHLAVHRDPSQRSTTPDFPGNQPITWVRPSELAMRVGSPVASRGIDLHTALVMRTRRAPASLAKAARRTSRAAIARPTPIPSREGVEL